MRTKQLSVAAILGFAVLATTAGTSHATSWTGSGSSDWNSGGNWLGFSQPGAADSAVFEIGSPFVVRASVNLSANTTIGSMFVDGNHFALGNYLFTRSNSALLTVNGSIHFGDATLTGTHTPALFGFQATANGIFNRGTTATSLLAGANLTATSFVELDETSSMSLNGSTLNSPQINLFDTASLNVSLGGVVNSGGTQITNTSLIKVDSGGTFNATGNVTIVGGTLRLNSGSTFFQSSTKQVSVEGSTSRFEINQSFATSAGAKLRAVTGGDIVGTDYIDIANGVSGELQLDGAGSSLTTAGSTASDWGFGAAGSFVGTLSNSAQANVVNLRMGTSNGVANMQLLSSSKLAVSGNFTFGGGATSRFVGMDINGGTLQVAGNSTFDNFADVNLIAGTAKFSSDAQFNAGSRLDWTGGTLDSSGVFLTFSGATFNRSNLSGELSNGSTLRILAGGQSASTSFFDLANGNVSGTLLVSGAGSTFTAGGLSDWGRNTGHTATVTINNGGIATLTGLRIGTNNGAATVTVASGGQLKPNTLEVGGGSTARTVNLTINGGTLTVNDANNNTTFNDKAVLNLQSGTFDPKGPVTFFTGSTANWSGGSFFIANGKTLTVSGGVINRTDTAASGLSPGATLAINTAGRFESAGSYSVGEFGAGTVTVSGADSNLKTNTNLTLGGSSAGQVGTVTLSNDGYLYVGDRSENLGNTVDVVVTDIDPIGTNGGVLSIANGSTLTSARQALIGTTGIDRSGRAVVTGASSQWTSGGNIVVGYNGKGELNIQSGGRVTAPEVYAGLFGGNGAINISGVNSALRSPGIVSLNNASTLTTTSGGRVLVGDSGDSVGVFAGNDMFISDLNAPALNQGGRVDVNGGSTFNHSGNAIVASAANHFGRIVVDGANSQFITSGLNVIGRFGTATADVQNGGQLRSTSAIVQSFDPGSNSTVTVTGASSLFRADGSLIVGRAGNAALNISAGGRAESGGSTLLSEVAGGVGTITVDGSGSALHATGNLTLDRGSTITTTNGGTVLVGDNAIGLASNRLVVGDSNPIGSGQGGLLTITGGSKLNHHFRVVVSPFANTFGEIRVNGANSELNVGEMLLVGNGVTSGTGLVTVESGGKVKTDVYQFTSPTSKIIINAGGTFEANSSMLGATRGAIASGYNGGNWLGANGITSVTAQSDSRLGIGYAVSGGTLTAKLALKGDTNLTGTVDFDDLLKLAQNYNGTGKFWQDGDFNYDASITFDDLLALAQNYGLSGLALPTDLGTNVSPVFASDWAMALSMVPEPGSISLLAGASMLRRRRPVVSRRSR